MAKKNQKVKIATLDLETDPFKHGNLPLPFAAGFFDGDTYHQTWGDNCIAEMMDFLSDYPEPLRIYVHNGGGFDFWYMTDYITNPVFFIKTRIVKCGLLDRHEMRDSYKMIPVPLKDFQKEEIDYEKFWYPAREKHKKEISYYLQKDCEYLYQLVTDFIARVGDFLTIGSAAISHLNKVSRNVHTNQLFDERFRPFYMGGRNQVFEKGKVTGNFKIYDVNSMYPYVMADMRHPYGSSYRDSKIIPDKGVSFAYITAESDGALPVMDHGLKFPSGVKEFWACSHEIHRGIELGLLKIKKVHKCYVWNATQRFDEFVDKFIKLKIQCEETGDKGGRLFYKLLLNNAYGKFGQNPLNFEDCELFESLDECTGSGYVPDFSMHVGSYIVGKKPAELFSHSFNNVAIAASITSAARAELALGLSRATRPLYCDTDSIICESLDMPLHDTKLGAWKTEAECNTIYIGGKKLYACYNDEDPLLIKGREKKASKGANLSADTIRKAAMGETIHSPIDAPLLRFGQQAKFIARNIRATA